MPAPARRMLLAAALLVAAAGAVLLGRALAPGADAAPPPRGIDWAGLAADVLGDAPEASAGPWTLALPGDHGAHPGARTEAWTLAARLETAEGAGLGLQVALLRVALAGGDVSGAAFGLGALHRGHVTLVRDGEEAAMAEERFQRDVARLAGHDPEAREIRLDGWRLGYGQGREGDGLTLAASVAGVPIELTLVPAKPALAVDPEGATPVRGYALPRLAVTGEIGADRTPVTGAAWLEHVWGDLPLPGGPVVSDRFQLALDDGTELLVTRTRRRDGAGTPTVSAVAIDAEGRAASLDADGLALEPVRVWRRGREGQGYPLDWRLRAGGLALDIAPVADDQLHAFASPVWAGTVALRGERDGRPVAGWGMLTLTEGAP